MWGQGFDGRHKAVMEDHPVPLLGKTPCFVDVSGESPRVPNSPNNPAGSGIGIWKGNEEFDWLEDQQREQT